MNWIFLQIISQDGKTSVILQAESRHDCMQWVSTINNISKGLYLANDPKKAAEVSLLAGNRNKQGWIKPGALLGVQFIIRVESKKYAQYPNAA